MSQSKLFGVLALEVMALLVALTAMVRASSWLAIGFCGVVAAGSLALLLRTIASE